MAVVHPWDDAPAPRQRHPWEDPNAANDDIDSDEEADPHTNKGAAARELVDAVSDLYLSSTISAEKFCTILYWAQRAGVEGGDIEAYAKKPGDWSRNYSAKCEKAFSFHDIRADYYVVKVPGTPSAGVDRGTLAIPFRLPHDILAEQLEQDPGILFRTDELLNKQG